MLTILTSTYNRAHTLPRLFESLCKQEDKSFEWLVIDDGSNDDSQRLLADFSRRAPFDVRIVYQENAGKHVAVNKGVVMATGGWIFIVDSDDALTPDAIRTVNLSLSDLADENVSGLCFRRAYFNGQMVGIESHFDSAFQIMKPSEAGALLKGDLAYIFRKEVLLKEPFPVVPGEKFVPELYIWGKIGDFGDIYYFLNKFIYLCEYLPDGYSRNFSRNLRLNPQGFLIYYKRQFFSEREKLSKLKYLIRYFQCYIYILLKYFR